MLLARSLAAPPKFASHRGDVSTARNSGKLAAASETEADMGERDEHHTL
jgi:hypothetical protein